MGIHVVRRIDELGEGLVLAPERHDPRRQPSPQSHPRLDSLVSLPYESATGRALSQHPAVLILDTSNAYEGFVVLRHAPGPVGKLGSSKRRVQPGDVLISRLRPYLRQVAYVDAGLFTLVPGGNAVVVSSEFFVLRDTSHCEAAALVPFLLSAPVQKMLAAGQEGGHHPRFPRELLAALPVPQAVIAQAPELAGQVRSLAGSLRAALLQGQALVHSIERCAAE